MTDEHGVNTGKGYGESITYCFGDAEFDPATRELKRGSQCETLQRKPARLLACLLASAGEVLSREELLDQVWGRRPTVENVLNNTIRRLRVALGDTLATRIVAITHIGYRFDGPVERRVEASEPVTAGTLMAGDRVPRRPEWRLAELLGRSALHEVWRARSADRRASRIFKFGSDARALAAMKRERAVSRLLHQVLGPDSGHVRLIDHDWTEPPFLVAAEDAGDDLRVWASRDPAFAAMPRAGRVALMIDILEAVGTAHGLGVLHKDLKPTNILIESRRDGSHKVRIGDFGSALLMEPSRLAALGITQAEPEDMPGRRSLPTSGTTPLYLAPELVTGGTATIRSDVYALGVVLYQLLIGDFRQPMATGWQARIGDPLLIADLEAATHGDPAQRLASADVLADRLSDLDGRRLTAIEKAAEQQEAERLRAALAAGRARRPWLIAAGVVLVIGIASTSFQLQRARVAERATQAQVTRVEAVNAFLNEDLLALANPLAGATTADPKFSELLALAEPLIDRRFANDPLSAATVRLSIADAYSGAARYREAAALRGAAIEQFGKLLPAHHPTLLNARYQRALSLVALGNTAEAKAELLVLDDELAMVKEVPPNLDIAASMVRGMVAQLLVEPDQARPHLLRVVELLARHQPDNLRKRINVEASLIDIDFRQGRFAEAESRARRILALDDPQISVLRRQNVALLLGQVLIYSERAAEALTHIEPAVAALREKFGDQHPRTLTAMSTLLNARTALGDWKGAVGEARLICDGFRATEKGNGTMTLYNTINLALAEMHSGDRRAAIATLSPLLADYQAKFGADNAATHTVRYVLAASTLRSGRAQDAARLSAGLDPKRLAEGDPSTPWAEVLTALDASIVASINNNDRAARTRAGDACRALTAKKTSPWVIASVCLDA